MDVQIVVFPETKVAAVEHRGSPQLEYETAKRLVAWRQRNQLDRNRHRSYGVHHTDPYTTPPADHRVDFCLSVEFEVPPNPELYREWLPQSGETLGDFPIFFHYVNVGPEVKEHDMITDVYLPLKGGSHHEPHLP